MNLGEARRLWSDERSALEARVLALRLALSQTLGALDDGWDRQDPRIKIKRAKEIGYEALASHECQLPEVLSTPPTAQDSIYHLPGVNLRDLNALEKHGYVLIADILATSRAMLILHVSNFGIRAVASVEQGLEKLGIDWPQDPEAIAPISVVKQCQAAKRCREAG